MAAEAGAPEAVTKSPNLPIVGSKPSIRPSGAGKWRAAVLIGVHLIAAIHIAHWYLSGSTLTPVEPSEAMEFAKHSVVNAGLVFFAAAILATAIFGRFFCGWGCHLVALQDFCRWLLLKIGIRPKPFRSRLLRWVPVGAFVYMFLWPAAYRLWVGDALGPVTFQMTRSSFWETFPGWALALVTFVVCGFVLVYFLGAKGFCTYACPYGGIFGPVDRLAPMAIRVTDACEGCAHCTATCSSNVRVHEEVRTYGRVVDSGCMKCLDCVSVCPKDALYLGFGAPAMATGVRENQSKPKRRPALSFGEEILVAATFLLALFVFRGLYNAFPFLFSLGWAALLSYLSLTAWHLLRRDYLRIQTISLKRDGRVQPAGYAFVLGFALLLLFWGHSGLVRAHGYLGDRLYQEVIPLTAAAIQTGSPPTMTLEAREHVEATADHLGFVDRWGLRVSPETQIRLAWLNRLVGRPAAFERYSEQALRASPRNSVMRAELADFYFRYGDQAKATRFYRELLALEPTNSGGALNLGMLLGQKGELAAAQKVLEEGIAATPDAPMLHYNLALALLSQRQPDAAVASFVRALQIDPNYLEARENLAGYLCSLGRFEEGLIHYRRAFEQSPNDPHTRMLAAQAYAALGDREGAEREIRRALELDPAVPGGRQLLEALLAAS